MVPLVGTVRHASAAPRDIFPGTTPCGIVPTYALDMTKPLIWSFTVFA
jgi:hypothetical protein